MQHPPRYVETDYIVLPHHIKWCVPKTILQPIGERLRLALNQFMADQGVPWTHTMVSPDDPIEWYLNANYTERVEAFAGARFDEWDYETYPDNPYNVAAKFASKNLAMMFKLMLVDT